MSGPYDESDRLGYPFEGRRRPIDGMVEFTQPLLDAAGHDTEKMNKALQFGMMFWNVAVLAEAVGEEAAREHLSEIESGLCKSAEDCRALRDVARTLFARHAETRPVARIDMLRLVTDLWGPDLLENMPKFGWHHRIARTAKRWLERKGSADEYRDDVQGTWDEDENGTEIESDKKP